MKPEDLFSKKQIVLIIAINVLIAILAGFFYLNFFKSSQKSESISGADKKFNSGMTSTEVTDGWVDNSIRREEGYFYSGNLDPRNAPNTKTIIEYFNRQQSSRMDSRDFITNDGSSRNARRITDIKQIQLALEIYYDGSNAQYPPALNYLEGNYIPNIPHDPLDGTSYFYIRLSNSDYHLGANLESGVEYLPYDLSTDSDYFSDLFDGNDLTGCNHEPNRHCFDVKP